MVVVLLSVLGLAVRAVSSVWMSVSAGVGTLVYLSVLVCQHGATIEEGWGQGCSEFSRLAWCWMMTPC